MLKNLLLFRQDIVERFDVNTPSGLADAVAWMYVRALPEYDLVGMVDPETLHALNTGVSYYPSPPAGMASAIQAQPAVEVSILMGLVWRHREDVQPHFDIRTPLGRAQFCLWFVESGVAELSLQGLVSAQKREWLLGVAPRSFAPKLPRLGVLAWLARPDLQAVIDLTTAKGVTDLTVWTRKSMQTNERWQWLTNPAKSSAMSRSFDSRWLRQPVAEFGVNLIGFARGELGIGEDVRMAVQACEAAGIAYSVVNISTGENTRQGDAALADSLREVSRAPYGVNIFCLTGFDSARVFFEQGASLFASRYNIGWWPWELPVWPAEWSVAFDLMD
jgi:hypothetical protein